MIHHTRTGTALAICCAAGAAFAQPAELLTNGGFESGDLTAWVSVPDEGAVTEGRSEPDCGYMNPHTPFAGRYFFSCAVGDGTPPGTAFVRIRQAVDITAEPLIALGNSFVIASCRVSGATGCNGIPSDDLARVTVEHRRDGDTGDLLQVSVSDALDPAPGAWRPLEVREPLADGADTLIYEFEGELDAGFASIDLGVDDTSLRLCHADLNGDLVVNTQDVLQLLNLYQSRDPRIDFNLDGQVNTADILAYLNLWQARC